MSVTKPGGIKPEVYPAGAVQVVVERPAYADTVADVPTKLFLGLRDDDREASRKARRLVGVGGLRRIGEDLGLTSRNVPAESYENTSVRLEVE